MSQLGVEGFLEIVVNANRNLPENEEFGVDVWERVLVFLLDKFLESSNRLCWCNLDWEDAPRVVSKYVTVKSKWLGIHVSVGD